MRSRSVDIKTTLRATASKGFLRTNGDLVEWVPEKMSSMTQCSVRLLSTRTPYVEGRLQDLEKLAASIEPGVEITMEEL
jgi:hypothetical protein